MPISISVTHVENVSIYVNKFGEVDCPHAISFDMPTTSDIDAVDILKLYDEIERALKELKN